MTLNKKKISNSHVCHLCCVYSCFFFVSIGCEYFFFLILSRFSFRWLVYRLLSRFCHLVFAWKRILCFHHTFQTSYLFPRFHCFSPPNIIIINRGIKSRTMMCRCFCFLFTLCTISGTSSVVFFFYKQNFTIACEWWSWKRKARHYVFFFFIHSNKQKKTS